MPGNSEPTDLGRMSFSSCNSVWTFDLNSKRFARLPRGSFSLLNDISFPDHLWNDYFDLALDPNGVGFVVYLNEEGTKLLRSYRHLEPCEYCDDRVEAKNQTKEFPSIGGE